MSNFVGTPLFSNPLWVAMETMPFAHSPNRLSFEDGLVSYLVGSNVQFGTHESCPGGGRVHSKLN